MSKCVCGNGLLSPILTVISSLPMNDDVSFFSLPEMWVGKVKRKALMLIGPFNYEGVSANSALG